MAYTFSWNADFRNSATYHLFNVHNPIIFDYRYVVSAPDTDPAPPTSNVLIRVKDKDGVQIYTNTFPAYLYNDQGGGAAPWEFDFIIDFTEIIRHIIVDMLYKELITTFDSIDLMSKFEYDVRFYDNAVLKDTESLAIIICHGLTQIGERGGSANLRLQDKLDESITYFLGFPMAAFFYTLTDLSAQTPRYTFTNKAGGTFTGNGAAGSVENYLHGFKLHDVLTIEKDDIKLYLDTTTPTELKTYHMTVIEACERKINEGLYVRFLDDIGGYTYWLFNRYYTRQIEGSHIGVMPKNFSMMRNEQIRNYNLGYERAFEKLDAVASLVPIEFQKKLQHLFISPAVYVWLGTDQYGYELCELYENDAANPYDTFTVPALPGTGISVAISDGSALQRCFATEILRMRKREIFNFVGTLIVNADQPPYAGIYDATLGFISNVTQLGAGANDFNLTCFEDSDNARLAIYNPNGDAANYALTVDHIKSENEQLWVLCDHVEGSHEIRTKKNADTFAATFVLNKLYTQKFSTGQ